VTLSYPDWAVLAVRYPESGVGSYNIDYTYYSQRIVRAEEAAEEERLAEIERQREAAEAKFQEELYELELQ
jgi:hypothetical protein